MIKMKLSDDAKNDPIFIALIVTVVVVFIVSFILFLFLLGWVLIPVIIVICFGGVGLYVLYKGEGGYK